MVFSLTSARAVCGIIDYTMKEERNHYSSDVAKLEEELFGIAPEDLFGFLKALSRGLQLYGRDNKPLGTFQISENAQDMESERFSLIKNYGTLSLAKIKQFNQSYIFGQN